MADRWVCLDVGETLIDETRVWTTWADVLGVPRLTFAAALGAAIAGGEHRDVFRIVDRADWRERAPEVAAAYGGFTHDDLYPDALHALDAMRGAGYRLAVIGNQPGERTAELRALGVDAEVIAMSDELGVHKPDPQFFQRALDLLGDAQLASVAYVGDRLDNDVLPSAAAGMRPVWLRRGPWGVIQDGTPPPGTLVVSSLAELAERVAECWS